MAERLDHLSVKSVLIVLLAFASGMTAAKDQDIRSCLNNKEVDSTLCLLEKEGLVAGEFVQVDFRLLTRSPDLKPAEALLTSLDMQVRLGETVERGYRSLIGSKHIYLTHRNLRSIATALESRYQETGAAFTGWRTETSRLILDEMMEEHRMAKKKILKLQEQFECDGFWQCDVSPIGEKVCGGPKAYYAFSNRLPPLALQDLEQSESSISRIDDTLAVVFQLLSDCMMVRAPQRPSCLRRQCSIQDQYDHSWYLHRDEYADPINHW